MAKKHRFDAKKPTAQKMTNGSGTTRPTLPRQAQLPGTEQVRNRKLDAVCHGLAEVRSSDAQNRMDELAYKASALREMAEKGVDSYTANGIRLDRLKGADKLAVHIAKDQVSAAPTGTPVEEAEV